MDWARACGFPVVCAGKGGYMVWGKILPAATSLARRGLPLGLAHDVKLTRPIARGQIVTWDDAVVNAADPTVAFRREMEQAFAPPAPR